MVCGSFRESAEKLILLDGADERALPHVIDLACGRQEELPVDDVREMGAFAGRYQMAEVAGVVKEAIVRNLTLENWGEVLRWRGRASGKGPLPLCRGCSSQAGAGAFRRAIEGSGRW